MLENKWSSYQVQKTPRDLDTSSEASLTSTNTDFVTLKTPHIRYRIDIAKEVMDNIPVFDGKQGELNQFLSTIETYSTMYRVCKVDLMMLVSVPVLSSNFDVVVFTYMSRCSWAAARYCAC